MRHFGDWLTAYCEFTEDSESPMNFHFWTGIATVAGALRRRVWIDMRKFMWTPNFYIILVAPAGIAAKSTSISIGMTLLSKLPTDVGIHFGPESMTWQKLADSLAKSTEYVKYIDNAGATQMQSMSALTCGVSELGTFLTMDDDKQLSFLIRMWDGGDATFIHSTKASGNVEVKSPWLNVIAATTPTWLAQNFPAVAIGGGLASRILFVHGEVKRKLIPYPDEVIQSAQYKERQKKLVEDLKQIALLAGPYTLMDEARDWGRQWYHDWHNGKRPPHLASDKYSGYHARKQTHIHKVAMVVAAARRDELYITKQDLTIAEGLVSKLEKEMLKAFESIGQSEVARAIHEMTKLLSASGGKLRSDQLSALCYKTMRPQIFKEALDTGVGSGIFHTNGRDGGLSVVKLVE